MTQKTVIRVFCVAAALLIAIMSLSSACAPAPTPAKPKVIKVAAVMDLTGPMSANTRYFYKGVNDYLTYVNEKKGGINGVKIELLWADDGYVLERGLAAYRRFVTAGAVAIFMISSPLNEALKARLESDRVPAISGSAPPPAVFPPGWIYTNRITYAPRFGLYVDWIKKQWKEARPPKLAHLTYDNPYGSGSIPEGNPYAKQQGIEVMATEFIPFLPTDLTPQLTRIRDKGVDFVFSNVVTATAAVIAKEAKRLGLQGKITFATASEGMTEDFLALAKDAAEGFVAVGEFAYSTEDNLPGVKLFKEVTTELHGAPEVQFQLEVIGFTAGIIAEEALRLAINEVGYEKVDGAALQRALNKIDGLDTGGLTPRISYKKERYNSHGRIVQVKGGKIVILTDWLLAPYLPIKP